MKEKEQQNKSMLEYIMHYGALLGMFWIFQYLFLIGEKYWVHFIYFFQLLNIVSPLLMYVFYIRYKLQTPEKKHNIWMCILFVVGICFFGSFFDAAIRYAHYAFIDPDFFANLSAIGEGIAESSSKMMQELGIFKNMTSEQIDKLTEANISIVTSKAFFIVSNMINQIFIGFIFSFLIAFLTRDRN